MSTETRLKPCPFCGGAAKEFERFNANVITCRRCGVKVRQSEMGEGDAAVRWNQRATPVAAQAQQPVSGADGLGGREAYESGRRVGLGFAHSVVSEIQRKHFYGSGIDGLNELIRAASDDIARELYAPTSATTDIQPQLSGNSGQFDHFADARKMASS